MYPHTQELSGDSSVDPLARLGRHARRPAIATIMLLLTGCGSAYIVRSNLDQYQEGAMLGEQFQSIPGDPEGDFVDNVLQQVAVTSGGTDILSGPKLHVVGFGGHEARVNYRTADHEVPDRYLIAWRGAWEHTDGQSTIRIQDGSGRNALVLRFERNRLMVVTGDGEQNPQPAVSEAFPHEIRVTVEMGNDKSVWVQFVQQGELLFNAARLELVDTAFSSLEAIQIVSDEGVSYFLQDLSATILN